VIIKSIGLYTDAKASQGVLGRQVLGIDEIGRIVFANNKTYPLLWVQTGKGFIKLSSSWRFAQPEQMLLFAG
jgi:hypothetical protein